MPDKPAKPTLARVSNHDTCVGVEASHYIHAATSDNTRAAYQSDIAHFLKAGGPLPTTPPVIEAYLRDCAPDYHPHALKRRLTALRQWHTLKGHPDPTNHATVMKTMRGIARLHGVPKQQASAIRLSDLDQLVAFLNAQASVMAVRNRALLLLGFFGAFRRSELVSLTWEHVQFVREGIRIRLPRSKTDQTGEGAVCVIPFGNETRCPVQALIDWRQAGERWEGPVFRRFSKTGRVLEPGISPRYWNRLIREIAVQAGLQNAGQMSSHSLRRGFATEAARLRASLPAIQRHGRWRSTKTVLEYIKAGREFVDSAVSVLFEF